jgi:hypothetical protein
LVMFDGFDEVAQAQRRRVSLWIGEQMQEFHAATFILSSRPAGFKDYEGQQFTTPITIEELNPKQQQDFIQRWYLCQERRYRQRRQAKYVADDRAQNLIKQLADRPELAKMAENPLLLNMITTFHRLNTTGELPKMRVDLYQGVCELQLKERPKARSIAMLLPYEKSIEILQKLALGMVKQNRSTIAQAPLLQFLAKQGAFAAEEVQPQAWLKQIVDVAELLVEREREEFEFPHLSFQGYFAATGLRALPQQGESILQYWSESWWQETILFYTAQLPPQQFTQIIQAAQQQGQPAADLAAQCLREYPKENKLDPSVRQAAQLVQASRYAKLTELLQAEQWEAADRETYRLMITTVGKEEGDYFSEKDLLEFPCEDLLKIDRLWVSASKGHFGFSVQKKIWEECGSITSYNLDDWVNFGDRVGWRRDGDWLSYDDFHKTPSLSPVGELPFWVFLFSTSGGGEGVVISSLAQRLVNCSTPQS